MHYSSTSSTIVDKYSGVQYYRYWYSSRPGLLVQLRVALVKPIINKKNDSTIFTITSLIYGTYFYKKNSKNT